MFRKRQKKKKSPESLQSPDSRAAKPDDTTLSSAAALTNLGDSVGKIDLQGATTALTVDGLEAALSPQDPGTSSTVLNDHKRYSRFASLGAGGVGIVDSCFDPNLSRYVALKKLQPALQNKNPETTRFVREARVMAQLEHPHIVPVHEMGLTEEGIPYFSMKKVRGNTLQVILKELRLGNKELAGKYTRRALLEIFRDVGQAVAFAHSRGIIHRDLKPANILLGEFGEVLLVDWGLAKLVGSGGDNNDNPAEADLNAPSQYAVGNEDVTLEGIVSGTPAYMAPEQAMGKISELNGQTDVYGLGTILYEMLTFQRMVQGETIREALHNVIHAPVIPPRKRAPDQHIPRDLEAICMKAVEKNPDHRYGSVKELLTDLSHFQNDLPISCRQGLGVDSVWKWCKRHRLLSTSVVGAGIAVILMGTVIFFAAKARYQEVIGEADVHRLKGNDYYETMWRTRTELSRLQAGMISKNKGKSETDLEKQLKQLEYKTRYEYDVAEALYLRAAAQGISAKARKRLFQITDKQILYYLLVKDYEKARGRLALIKNFYGEKFEKVDSHEREKFLKYDTMARKMSTLRIQIDSSLQACQLITLSSDQGKNLATRALPVKGDLAIAIEQGSYIIKASLSHGGTVNFPVYLQDFAGQKIHITVPSALPEGMVLIPAGHFIRGGYSSNKFRQHLKYLDAFFIKKTEVTFGEYITFWLADDGGAKATRLRSRVSFDNDRMVFTDAWDDQGRLLPQFTRATPVVGISKHAADRYCQWLSKQSGRIVRLPTDEEWEKAARGVDGRTFPWGRTFEPDFAFTYENTAARKLYPLFAPIGSFPRDRSVYGVLDMGGNVREWTSSLFGPGSRFYQIKGGSAILTRRFAATAYSGNTPAVPSDVGFRYIMPDQ